MKTMLGLVFGWLTLDEVVPCAEAEVTSIKINASDVILIFNNDYGSLAVDLR
jgi:hypothetical protein